MEKPTDFQNAMTEILQTIAKYHLTFGDYAALKEELDRSVSNREIGARKEWMNKDE